MEFCSISFIHDSRMYQNFYEVKSIDKKCVGRFMYKISICTKYNIFLINIIKTIRNINLP